jgi:rhodanese-related sulfurtransferase
MPAPEENDPISDDEILYRRIPLSKGWINESRVSMNAFKPRPDDDSGISVYRARFLSVEAAAQGLSKQGYYVVAMRAGDLRAAGIDIVPKPLDAIPGHAEIPSLAFQPHESDVSAEHRRLLADR